MTCENCEQLQNEILNERKLAGVEFSKLNLKKQVAEDKARRYQINLWGWMTSAVTLFFWSLYLLTKGGCQ